MKRYLLGLFMILTCALAGSAQVQTYDAKATGSCGQGCKWMWDGYTLTIYSDNYEKNVKMDNYNTSKNLSPWKKKKIAIHKVKIEKRVVHIGDCAFYDLPHLEEVEFIGSDLSTIGWGAFLDCRNLRQVKFPSGLRDIGKIAFANCDALTSITIPDNCRVGEQAFASCYNLRTIDLSPTSMIGRNAFAGETTVNGQTRHTLFTGTVVQAPSYITQTNCNEYGLSRSAISDTPEIPLAHKEYNFSSSSVDAMIPEAVYMRNNTYALVIGNQDYRFASDVPGAIHDANIFKEYCRKTLGIPSDNIHLVENATKAMIMQEEIQDWLGSIPDKGQKTLIVYYSGNGLPDLENGNKAYLLPSDVRGTSPHHGIALDDFYRQLGNLGFNQTTVLLDASFSGLNRYKEGVSDGSRTSGVYAEKVTPSKGNIVVISASEGKEAALGLPAEGHGLFTYCLLKEIKDTNGVMSLGTLYDRLCSSMPAAAASLKKGATQTPQVKTSDTLATDWRSVRL